MAEVPLPFSKTQSMSYVACGRYVWKRTNENYCLRQKAFGQGNTFLKLVLDNFFKAPLSSSFFSLGCIHPGVCSVAAKYFGIAPKWKKLPRTTLISGAQKFFPLIKRIFAGPQKARRLERVQSKAATSLVVQVSKSCNKQTINRSNQFQMTLWI